MKKKTRRFDEGGFLTKEGKNENIDDDTRARARKFVEDGEESPAPKAESKPAAKSSSSAPSKPAPKAEPTKVETKAESKPKAETADEYKERMEGLTKKQALEKVEPEDYVPGPGLLKNLLKRGGKEVVKTIERKALPAPKPSIKQIENNATKRIGLDKDTYKSATEKAREARANARMNRMREENADAGAPGRARASGSTNDMGGTFNAYELRPDFKRGGSVKAKSASKRADGCAIRGKTRA